MSNENNTGIFAIALGIKEPWKVVKAEFIPSKRNPGMMEVHVYVGYCGKTHKCPACGKENPVQGSREGVWQHLCFFQHSAYVHAKCPKVQCGEHGMRNIEAPWAKAGSGFTLV